ncbi:MAG: peptidoglycan binding protein CsiV [Gammaproteobacteria bacterium]|jgi:hypothetical protein|nr:peptidoglycan binding protein CsiV [Gammaproteobacteria bacterium]
MHPVPPTRRGVGRPGPLRAVLLLAALASGAAAAAPYRVELLAFAREDSEAAPEEPAKLSCLARATPIGTDPASAELPRTVPAARHLMVNEAQALRRRGSGFRLLLHVAWEQDIPDGKTGPWLQLPATTELAGCLRAGLRKEPEVEIVLSYLPDPSDQYRVQVKRPVRPGEVSYLDDPSIGVLVRLDPTAPDALPPSAPSTAPAGPAPAGRDAPPGAIPPPPKKPFRW